MELIVFTKGDDPIMREAQELGQNLTDQGLSVEMLDTEDLDGQQKASVYDIYSTPSFLVVRDEGSVLSLWRGTIPPRGELEQLLRG